MTRPTDWVNTRPRLGTLLGGAPGTGEGQPAGPSCCDPDPTLPDRGSDGIAWAQTAGTLAFVQKKTNANANSIADISVTLDTPATAGNLLIAFYSARTGSSASGGVTPAGWTRYPNDFSGPAFDGGASTIFYKTAAGGESTITVVKGGSDYASLEVSEYSGNLTFDTAQDSDSVSATTSLVTQAITPAGTNVLLYAAFNQSARAATYTWGGSFTELSDVNVFTSGPSSTSGYRLITGASGSYTGSCTSTESDGYGRAILSFTAGGAAWTVRSDPVLDGDDTTYQTVTGTDLIRLDLGAAHRIVSTRIRIAANTAGARTFTVKAANLVDFSDEVTLGTIAFTATGSYTAQDVTGSWTNTTAYRYYELSIGTSDTYRVHAWELYEGTLATDFAAHTGATSGAHDAGAVDYDNSGSGLTADNVQDAIDELAAGGSGGQPVFRVIDYGATGDGTTDDTAAILATQDAAVAAGGGIVFFNKPTGDGYLANGSLLDTSRSNSILRLPSLDALDDEQITIVWMGELPPPPVMSVVGATTVPNNHVVIKTTTNSGSGTPALLGGWGPSGSFEDFTFLFFGCYNITFRLPSNPVLTAVDTSHVTAVDFDQVVMDVGSYYVQGLTEPTTSTSYGLKLPGLNNGAYTRLGAVNVIGFYNGIQVGEHTYGEQVALWGCKRGIVTVAGYHASHFDRLMTVHCERGIVATGGTHYLSVDQYNTEHAVSGWWITDYDVDDPSNWLIGRIEWKVTKAGTGHDSTWTVNGAANLLQNEMGTVVGALTPASAVEDETTWGIAPAVGTDLEYARQDHTHGTPDEPVSIGPILITSVPAGSPLIFADLLQNSDGTDLLYASAP